MPKYQHFKGGIYEYLFTAIHSETDEKLVIYKNAKGIIFARPYTMFFENVMHEGRIVPRFRAMNTDE
ncbi:DUF1653 domain-containing protein [Dehalobacter sp. DCM]|uniref:DUF1653 domain-containing protein n=1 Tax=Dehalobacter sp. DCM TaxID=2907827 RepID=UPI003081612B|nr:DUF1653 domain-containing protein [Dehalobacter sp. DCM]